MCAPASAEQHDESFASSPRLSVSDGGLDSRLEVGPQVLDVFDPDAQSYKASGSASDGNGEV